MVVLTSIEITVSHERPKSSKIILCRFCGTLPPMLEVVLGSEWVDRDLEDALYSRTELFVSQLAQTGPAHCTIFSNLTFIIMSVWCAPDLQWAETGAEIGADSGRRELFTQVNGAN
ncbi:hypothetical protein PoB_006135600 [Plakobranchus ocellatus]|uniref:Uncharacterized protein n=1 Tax=Plakobranchus ocellatus TaxID=259542 RepID=A0AAV4CSL0_9GAST|nr:hypothetical protein PoB_006135600 [Plakobranchus ocellatus]